MNMRIILEFKSLIRTKRRPWVVSLKSTEEKKTIKERQIFEPAHCAHISWVTQKRYSPPFGHQYWVLIHFDLFNKNQCQGDFFSRRYILEAKKPHAYVFLLLVTSTSCLKGQLLKLWQPARVSANIHWTSWGSAFALRNLLSHLLLSFFCFGGIWPSLFEGLQWHGAWNGATVPKVLKLINMYQKVSVPAWSSMLAM